MSDGTVIDRVRELVTPIASDLDLELYDVERNSGTLRVLVDTPPGSDEGITVDTIALVSRLVSRELDHADPIPGRYTLEVSSPGVERPLRTPDHFRAAIGRSVAVRLRDVPNEQRRVDGELVAADDTTITIRTEAAGDAADEVHVVRLDQIDRARTTFVWGPAASASSKSGSSKRNRARSNQRKSNKRKEKRSS